TVRGVPDFGPHRAGGRPALARACGDSWDFLMDLMRCLAATRQRSAWQSRPAGASRVTEGCQGGKGWAARGAFPGHWRTTLAPLPRATRPATYCFMASTPA